MAEEKSHSWLAVPGVVLPVIRQAKHTCWAYVGLEAISSQYKALHSDEDHLQLSIQQALNCVKEWYLNRPVPDEEKDDKYNYTRVFLYAAVKGFCLDRDYRLNREDKRCNPPPRTMRFFVQDYAEPKDEEEVKEALSKFPIAGAVHVYRSFVKYREGIYNGPTPDEENDPRSYLGKHAILLTGIPVVDGVELYQFKNTWDETWGQDGIGLIRKDLVFGIAHPTNVFWSYKGEKGGGSGGGSKGKKRDEHEDKWGGSGTKQKGYQFGGSKGKTKMESKSGHTAVKHGKGGGGKSRHNFGDAGKEEERSSQSPPQKKQKVDEQRDGTEAEEEEEMLSSENDSDDSNGCFTVTEGQWDKLKHDYCPDGVEELDQDVWCKYLQEIKESEGFDIYHYPGRCWMAQYTPLNVDENTSSTLKVLIELSTAAISDLNQKEDANYKLEKVEKANAQLWDIGVNYYITFQAKDSDADAFETFQALVWEGPGESTIMKFCRRKPVVVTLPILSQAVDWEIKTAAFDPQKG